ncbi:MAG: DUF1416 domain-containing protein [Actinomycetales bacterium]|nr:DUF1416 domain-containing protein [Actinomycetales bacterium]
MSTCTSPGDPNAAGSIAIHGRVLRNGTPVRGYVRLLDARGDFVAEVPAQADGSFTFYAVAGSWILRAITGSGTFDKPISLDADRLDIDLELAIS